MHTAFQPVVEIVDDTLALRVRRGRRAWSSHDTSTDIVSTVQRGYKPPPHIDHATDQLGRVGSRARLRGIGLL